MLSLLLSQEIDFFSTNNFSIILKHIWKENMQSVIMFCFMVTSYLYINLSILLITIP